MSTPNIDDVAQTLAEYERLAISSGARVRIDPPEFSADGATWSPIWLAAEPPVAARATVHRDDIPTTVYAGWAESLPVETSLADDGRRWCDIWVAKPMQRFGSFVIRSALRRAFREVIGDRTEPDEDAPRVAPPTVDRDWDAEIPAASTAEELSALHAEMKAARSVTVSRERALRARRLELLTEPAADVDTAWEPESSERPAPQDHLPPANRAARRKAARKKGRR